MQSGSGVREKIRHFKASKSGLSVMAYHRQGALIRLTTDALPVGIGAILEQEQEDRS